MRRSAEKSAEAHVAYVEQIALERQAVQMAAETAAHAASDNLQSLEKPALNSTALSFSSRPLAAFTEILTVEFLH